MQKSAPLGHSDASHHSDGVDRIPEPLAKGKQSKNIVQSKTRKEKESQGEEIYFLPEREPLPRALSLNLPKLQSLMWDKVGIIRSGEELIQTAATLATWQRSIPRATDRPSYELNNLVLCARLMAEAALLREESRGAHFRTDFPESRPEWQKHITFLSSPLMGED